MNALPLDIRPALPAAPIQLTNAPVTPATAAPWRGRALGLLLIFEALLALAPVAALGPAIGWPASLGRPAAQQLSAIAAAPGAVALGYGLYLLYSLLIAPVMIGLAARAFGGLHRPLAATVAAFAALSSLARCIGILRWLSVMPVLAVAHAHGDAAGQAQVALLFDALHAWGGGIGEWLGVSLTMAMALGTLCAGALPRGLAVAGGGVALLLLCLSAPAIGWPVPVPTAAAVSALSLWLFAAGVWVWAWRSPG